MNNDNKIWEQKDKRISFLSILSSLCLLHQGGKYDAVQLAEEAKKINARLYIDYPFPKESDLPSQKTMDEQAKKIDGSGNTKICPVPDCGKLMIRQHNKKNPKSPDWKCSDSKCKFKKAYDGGWRKSDFITGAWDEPDTTEARHADNNYESNQQEIYDTTVPPEYGG